MIFEFVFFFQAEDGIRDSSVTGVQTCALPIWLDPMCGLMLAFIVAAGLWHRRRTGGVARIDFSMIEAMLWTMAEPLLATQLAAPPKPLGNHSSRYVPHAVYRCAGEDKWISVVA